MSAALPNYHCIGSMMARAAHENGGTGKLMFVLLSRFFMSLDISGPTSEFDDN